MAEKIRLPKQGDITKLAKSMNVGYCTVRQALAGDDTTELKKQIRKTSLYKCWGGVKFPA